MVINTEVNTGSGAVHLVNIKINACKTMFYNFINQII